MIYLLLTSPEVLQIVAEGYRPKFLRKGLGSMLDMEVSRKHADPCKVDPSTLDSCRAHSRANIHDLPDE